MIKVLFVCHGNICRSPMAEFVMKDIVSKKGLDDSFHIESCATTREEIGNDIHRGTRKKLIENNISFNPREARIFNRKDYENFDYIIGMDDENKRDLLYYTNGDPNNKIHLLLDFTEEYRDVADPWWTGNFDITYDDIVRGCNAFLKKVLEEN